MPNYLYNQPLPPPAAYFRFSVVVKAFLKAVSFRLSTGNNWNQMDQMESNWMRNHAQWSKAILGGDEQTWPAVVVALGISIGLAQSLTSFLLAVATSPSFSGLVVVTDPESFLSCKGFKFSFRMFRSIRLSLFYNVINILINDYDPANSIMAKKEIIIIITNIIWK